MAATSSRGPTYVVRVSSRVRRAGLWGGGVEGGGGGGGGGGDCRHGRRPSLWQVSHAKCSATLTGVDTVAAGVRAPTD